MRPMPIPATINTYAYVLAGREQHDDDNNNNNRDNNKSRNNNNNQSDQNRCWP